MCSIRSHDLPHPTRLCLSLFIRFILRLYFWYLVHTHTHTHHGQNIDSITAKEYLKSIKKTRNRFSWRRSRNEKKNRITEEANDHVKLFHNSIKSKLPVKEQITRLKNWEERVVVAEQVCLRVKLISSEVYSQWRSHDPSIENIRSIIRRLL